MAIIEESSSLYMDIFFSVERQNEELTMRQFLMENIQWGIII